MAGNLLPLLLVGGAAVAIGGRKKKKKKRPAAKEAKKLPAPRPVPEGFGLGEGAVDESDLQPTDEPTGAAAGDFEEVVEDFEESEDDAFGEPADPVAQAQQVQQQVAQKALSQKEKCVAFIGEIHVIPTEVDEMPINKVAVEQSIVPAMRSAAIGIHNNLNIPFDEEAMGPQMVLSALEAVAPECGWEYSDAVGEFRYAGGESAHTGKVGDVLNAMFDLTVMVLNGLRSESGEE